MAQSADPRVMTVRLPDGGIAEIRYASDVAPQVSFVTSAAPLEVFAPLPSLFGSGSPFAEFERISAALDRQAAAMFRQAEVMAERARSGQLTEAAMREVPPGSQSYSFVSTMSGSGVCTQSVEITAQGKGAPPRIVSHRSGNCGPSGGASGSVNLPTAAPPGSPQRPVWINVPAAPPRAPAARPDILWTSAPGARPYAGLIKEIPAAQR